MFNFGALALGRRSNRMLGRDIVTDGGFTNTANWGEGAGWSVAGNILTISGTGATTACNQGAANKAGALYLVEFDVLTVTNAGGGISARVGSVAGAVHTTVGHKREYIRSGPPGDVGFMTRGNGLFAGTLDNLSARQVLQ